jgi:urease accessory protein UreF
MDLNSITDATKDAADDAVWNAQEIRDEKSLRSFLAALLANRIARVDLPMVRWAREAAARNDSKGLVELDRILASTLAVGPLREASVRAGQQQLRKLRPIKGHRFLARYIAEVESERACGFQPVVYGVYLFLFSVALREGLMNYAYQTLQGFVGAAARTIRLDEAQRKPLVEDVCAGLPQLVEQSLAVERSTVAPRIDATASGS